MSRTLFGDWRDLRAAIEAAVPGWQEMPEAERKRIWDQFDTFVKNYAPMYATCEGCGKEMTVASTFRCADCHTPYCERCIRPHFEGKL